VSPEGAIVTAKASPERSQQEQAALEKFLRLAQDRFKLAAEAESENRKEMLDDLEFRVGNQWPFDIQAARQLDGRPCITINRLPQFLRQVCNEQRQQRPSIQINPVGDGADTDTAEILQGIVRHIEVNSDAEIAYDTAFEQCVTVGLGFYRISTDYIPGTKDQEIFLKRIKNQFTVYFDPAAIEPDYSDARYCFIIEDVPISEYKATYGDSEAAGLVDFQSIGDQAPDWATKDTIRVAEYFHIEGEQDDERTVVWSKINAVEILDEQDWPGMWIPIVPVLGDDLDVNGKRHLAGLVRYAKDPQRMYNYWNSSATEMIALAPKAPWVGAEGQFAGREGEWSNANTKNYSYLQYKPVGIGGTPLPPPTRQSIEPPIQAMSLMIARADADLKTTTGLFDPSLGQNKGDQSGKAVQLLQKQGDVSVLNYVDNLTRAMRFTGKILLDLIPKIYDAPRVQRIIQPDSEVKHVIVHNGQPDDANEMALQSAKGNEGETVQIPKIYDLGTGRYDVTVSVGPSYQTKRQESVAAQMALVQAFPAIVPIAGDIIVGNMDWPGAKEISKRLKKMLPPNLQDQDDQSPEAQLQRSQAQTQALAQQHQALMQEVQKLSEIIKTDQLKYQSQALIAQMNNASKERIADIQEKAALIATEAKIQAQNAQLQLTTEIERINQQLGMLHEHVMADKQHQQAQQLADQQAQQAQQSQEADQQHQQDMAQQAQEAQAQQPEGNDAGS
jgi:Phage P22-like portal protein